MTDPDTRNHLRRALRAERNRLTPGQQARAAQGLAVQLAGTRLFRVARRIALYLPNDGEVDPVPLMTRVWAMNKTCYLPILSRLKHDRLWFAPYEPDTVLAPNRFGIPEPLVAPRTWLRAPDLDLILMPLVAFDARGNRLGMGGGFYDRSLAFLRHRGRWHKPRLIGLAPEFQRVDQLETFAWDVPLQAVATDRAVYHFQQQT